MQLQICQVQYRVLQRGPNNATLPYALMLANKGYREAFKSNQPLSLGLNTYKGHVTNKGVAEAFEMEYKSVEEALQL